MRSRYFIASVALLTLAIAGCDSSISQPPTPIANTPIAIDTNAVISVSQRQNTVHIVSKTSGRDIVPGIDIHADGRCFIRRFDGTELEKRIAPTAISDLLSFLDRTGFFNLTDAQIQAQIAVAQQRPGGGTELRAVSDDHYTAVFARTSVKTNRIERYALDHELKWYPAIDDLRVLRDAFRQIRETVGETGWKPAITNALQ